MKFIISVILIALLSFATCLYLPWWMVAIAGFVVAAFIPQKPGLSFLSGFLAVNFLWIGMSLWISNANEFLFAHKMSLLILKSNNIPMLITATGLIGGIVAGMGALTGSFIHKKRSAA